MPAHATILAKPRKPPPTAPEALPRLFWRGDDGAAALTTTTAQLQQLVRELHAAWRQKAPLRAAGALCTPPILEEGAGGKAGGGESSMVVVLLRAPMLLRVRVALRGAGPAGGREAAQAPAWLVAAITAALQPWLGPLALSLGFLGSN